MANPELSPMKLEIASDLGPAMNYSTYIVYLASIMKYLLRLLTQRHWRDRIHGVNAIMGIGHASPYPSLVVQRGLVSGGMQDRFNSQCFGLVVPHVLRLNLKTPPSRLNIGHVPLKKFVGNVKKSFRNQLKLS